MARFNKIQTLEAILRTGMVPVYYHPDAAIARQVVKACYEGGVRVFEFTNRGDFAQEVFGELSKFVARECPELILGVGSVVDPATAALYIQLGANFVVGPLFNPEIARVCNQRGWPLFREKHQGSHAVEPHHGYRSRGAYRGESRGMDESRHRLRGDGLQALPERGRGAGRLAGHIRPLPPRAGHHPKTQDRIRGTSPDTDPRQSLRAALFMVGQPVYFF